MVKSLLSSLIVLTTATAIAAEKTITLSQKDVAELVLKQGFRTKEVNLASQQLRLPYYQALAAYDWNLLAESG